MRPRLTTQNHKSLSLRAALYVAAICVAILGLEGWREWNSYEADLQRVVSANFNLAHSLREHAEDTFELAELAVTSVASDVNAIGLEADGLPLIEKRMRQVVNDSSRLLRVDLFDAMGDPLATTQPDTPLGPRQTSYSYFQNHRASASRANFIGRPLQLPNGDWVLTVSQRVNRPDGSFGGVVVATIDCRYFADFYQGFDVGKQGSISLATTNGFLLARSPYDTRQIGRDLGSGGLFAQELAVRSTGYYQPVSQFDGVRRISAFDTSHRYPIVAVVAVSRDEALTPWFSGALQRLGIALVLTIGLAILGLRLAEQISRRQRSEAVLAQKEAEFRLLAESASDLVERFDVDGRRLYVSPAMQRLLGRRPEELVGTIAFETVCEEDRPAMLAAASRLRRQETTEETIVFRAQHADGREIWLESALRVATDNVQERISVVGVTRDVTERKLLEMKLASLATVDGLTGLANRRAFDEAVAREVARCRRSHSPLSLLMIDCDRFKRFNDDYGHLAGDACLKAVASAIMARARRPLDVAARYGGEEMALLLPDTELGVARAIGVELCRVVQALDIPHDRNLPWTVATISVGVATLDYQGDGDTRDGTWLVNTADLALYDAKAQGRNQCVAPPLAETTRLVG